MKNIKRILAVVIALTMMLGAFASISAAGTDAWYTKAVDYLESQGIAEIVTKADAKITREDFILWVDKIEAASSGNKELTKTSYWADNPLQALAASIFDDTGASAPKYKTALVYAYQRGFISGDGDGKVRPQDEITLAEACKIIVHLMGYEKKVGGSTDNWQYNYFRVANNFCNAIDATFVKEVGSINVDLTLSYGEAAYLLSTILNHGTTPVTSLTADGENLGEEFQTGSISATSQGAIVSGLKYVTPTWNYLGWQYAVTTGWPAGKTFVDYTTNVIDVTGDVTLNVISENGELGTKITMATDEFEKLVRVSFGLSKVRDWANGETFNLGDYVSNGSYVKLKTDAAGKVEGVELLSTYDASKATGAKAVSDTFIVATSLGTKWAYNADGSIKTIGKAPYLANTDTAGNNYTPVLPTAYTSNTYEVDGATKYAMAISFTGRGTDVSLVFKGFSDNVVSYSIEQTRTLADNEIVVYDVNNLTAPLSDAEVVARIPNTAAGEACVEFSDIDGDGFYDVAVIREYSLYAYRNNVNADPQGVTADKGQALGGVMIDASYTRTTGSTSTDNWDFDPSKAGNGKVTLLVCASNQRYVAQESYYISNTISMQLPYYQELTLWDLTTAYIESVQKDPVDIGGKQYFEVVLKNVADGTKKTAYVPVPDVLTTYVQETAWKYETKTVMTDGTTEYVPGTTAYLALDATAVAALTATTTTVDVLVYCYTDGTTESWLTTAEIAALPADTTLTAVTADKTTTVDKIAKATNVSVYTDGTKQVIVGSDEYNAIVADSVKLQEMYDTMNLSTTGFEAPVYIYDVMGKGWTTGTTVTEVIYGTPEWYAIPTADRANYVKVAVADEKVIDTQVEQFTNIPTTQKVNITIAGATTTVTLASTEWLPFLTSYLYSEDEGINSVCTPATTAAWMDSKVVKYAVAGTTIVGATGKAADIVTVMTDTTKASASGFIVGTKKTETGDNTYNVTLAQSGAINDPTWVKSIDAYWTYTRFGGWNYMNWKNAAVQTYDASCTETTRQQMTTMGWTDVDKWVASVWATGASYNATGNIWAEAKAIIKAAGLNASVFDMTLADIATTYASVAANVTSLITNYANYNSSAADTMKFGAVLDAIPGFDKTVFLANVTSNLKNVDTNAKYRYWVCQAADIIRSGFLTTSKVVMGPDAPQKGYFTSLLSFKGATSVKTYEVRANASSLWDYDNYSMYNSIYNGTTIQTTSGSTTKLTGNDLIYVQVYDDGASQYVIQYLDETASVYAAGSTGWVRYYSSANSAFAGDWQTKGTMTYYKDARNEASYWNAYAQGIILDSVDLSKITTTGTTTVTVRVGYNPYYLKTGRSFERYWTTVGTYDVDIVTTYAAGDSYTTYIPVVDATGAQIKVVKEAEKADWESKTVDGNGIPATYKVIDKLLYKVNTITAQFKYDAAGNKVLDKKIDYDNMRFVSYENGGDPVKMKASEVVGLLDIEAMTSTDTGYYPGAYKVSFDGKTYIAGDTTPIVVMEPNFSNGNLNGTATTLQALVDDDYNIFASYHQIAYNGVSLDMLSVIGEITGRTGSDDKPVDNSKTVYLGKPGVTIEVEELGKSFVVRSTYSASVLPTCEEFGSIRRTYSTYAEAKYAAEVNLVIDTGYYVVDGKTGEIGKALTSAMKKGAITELDALGAIKATIDGKDVDATNFKWTFLYTDFDGNLSKAGDSKNVAIAKFATVEATLTNATKAYSDAKAIYESTITLGLSATTQAKYKAVMDAAEADLEAAKQSAVAQYLNGQFWGGANSPAYNYVTSYKYTYQKDPDPITFEYVVIDGTYCVFVNSFFG